MIFLGLKKKKNKKNPTEQRTVLEVFHVLCRPVPESCDITFHVYLLVPK